MELCANFSAPVQVTVNYYHTHQQGVDWVFVDHPCFQRPGEKPKTINQRKKLPCGRHGICQQRQLAIGVLQPSSCSSWVCCCIK